MMQRILIFTIEEKVPKIGLWQPHAPVEWAEIMVSGETRADGRLFEALQELLVSQHCRLEQVTHIGVMTGPATYTQLRVVISIANALAWARGLPIFTLAATDTLPVDISKRIGNAKVNTPVQAIYPGEIS